MMRRLVVGAVAAGTAVVLSATPALAYDCIRVSGSSNGLQNSTKSGNWEYLTVDGFLGGLVAQGAITAAEASCMGTAYAATGAPTEFAIGVGVAGAHANPENPGGGGVLAKNAPDKVLSDGKGIDHLDDSVLPALAQAAAACGVQLQLSDG